MQTAHAPRPGAARRLAATCRQALGPEAAPPGRIAYSWPLVLYVGAVAGIAVVCAAWTMTTPTDLVGVGLVSVAVLLISVTSTRLGAVHITVSSASFLHLGLAITAGPFGAVAASTAEVAAVVIRFRSGWFRSLFNWSNNLVCGLAAWATYRAIAPMSGPMALRTAVAGAGAGAVHYVINYGLLAGVLTLATHRPLRVHVRAALSACPYHLMYGYAAVSFVVLHDHFGAPGFTFALAPVAALQIHLVILASRSAAYEKQRTANEEQLRHQALHDPLTQLANRVLLTDRIDHALARQRRTLRSFAILVLDLDNFKTVNDSLGHAAGDQLLVAVAGRLRAGLRASDSAARFGGDEFAVLLEDVPDADQALHVAERLVEALRQPFTLQQRQIFLGVSIGVAISSEGEQTADEMLRDADLAMYAAKAQGRGRHVVFAPRMREAALDRVALEQDLRRAITDGELHLVYQPQIDLGSGAVVGVEALVRWIHPIHGNVSPDRFIPLAEEAGLIGALDAWVLETACAQTEAWRDAGLGGLRVAVNLSGSEFEDGALVDRVSDVLARHRLQPTDLELEITERVAVQQQRSARETLDRLRAMGVRIAIDDFGTGYSMLASLQRFPGDKLKIDKSFVQEIADDQDGAPLVAAIIAMGHGLGLGVVAEGVETEAQLAVLRRLGCDEAQGYLLGRPAEAEVVEEQVRAGRSARCA